MLPFCVRNVIPHTPPLLAEACCFPQRGKESGLVIFQWKNYLVLSVSPAGRPFSVPWGLLPPLLVAEWLKKQNNSDMIRCPQWKLFSFFNQVKSNYRFQSSSRARNLPHLQVRQIEWVPGQLWGSRMGKAVSLSDRHAANERQSLCSYPWIPEPVSPLLWQTPRCQHGERISYAKALWESERRSTEKRGLLLSDSWANGEFVYLTPTTVLGDVLQGRCKKSQPQKEDRNRGCQERLQGVGDISAESCYMSKFSATGMAWWSYFANPEKNLGKSLRKQSSLALESPTWVSTRR